MAVTAPEAPLALGCNCQRSHHGKQRTEQEPKPEKRSKDDAERKACKEGRKEEVLKLLKNNDARFVSKVRAALTINIDFLVLRLGDGFVVDGLGYC